jgi:hypothetical protein
MCSIFYFQGGQMFGNATNQELTTAFTSELNSDALPNADDVIQPKSVLPDFVVRQKSLA